MKNSREGHREPEGTPRLEEDKTEAPRTQIESKPETTPNQTAESWPHTPKEKLPKTTHDEPGRPQTRHRGETSPYRLLNRQQETPNDETPRTKEKDAPPPSHSVGTTIDRNRRKKEHIQDGGALHRNHAPQITEFRRKSKKGKTTPDETLPKEPTPTSRRRTPASQCYKRNETTAGIGLGSSAGEGSSSRDNHISESG
ncbi:hypothetical protein F2Q68_00035426 [Brassica cretica]|uniref:Uncharacterized protein n=1 Tax=Brassica cretica TaxID=69181 RepID=A0A8S9GYA2_BRACR|nr:hypothetical protein F2Q68_00035426 [Brassica cretica]